MMEDVQDDELLGDVLIQVKSNRVRAIMQQVKRYQALITQADIYCEREADLYYAKGRLLALAGTPDPKEAAKIAFKLDPHLAASLGYMGDGLVADDDEKGGGQGREEEQEQQ